MGKHYHWRGRRLKIKIYYYKTSATYSRYFNHKIHFLCLQLSCVMFSWNVIKIETKCVFVLFFVFVLNFFVDKSIFVFEIFVDKSQMGGKELGLSLVQEWRQVLDGMDEKFLARLLYFIFESDNAISALVLFFYYFLFSSNYSSFIQIFFCQASEGDPVPLGPYPKSASDVPSTLC